MDPNRRNGRRTSRANAPPATAADYYANIDKSLSGNQFRAQLTELIGDHSSISYGALWDAFEVLGNGGHMAARVRGVNFLTAASTALARILPWPRPTKALKHTGTTRAVK